MRGSLVVDLGVGPNTWLFLSILGCATLFFKFSRVWSVRNLDLLLLFAFAPAMMVLVGNGDRQPWLPFLWLFVASGAWLIRCVSDLGLVRRPMLEPNLNASGLACLSVGILALLVAETVSLPVEQGARRNPADPGGRVNPPPPGSGDQDSPVNQVLQSVPLPSALKPNPPQLILSRVLASLAHLGLVAGLIAVGWRHFERPIAGLSVATCYLISPYTRISLDDSGQLVPAALVVAALVFYIRPATAGVLIGLAAGWMPACLGLVPLWSGFYRGRGGIRFAASAVGVIAACAALAAAIPGLARWSRALGARSLAEAGLLPGVVPTVSGSFWLDIDGAYRLPVLIAYVALVLVTTLWPAEKNLGELIALSAATLIASQFWYLDEGGTMVLLYLPLILLMMFRPNLNTKRPIGLTRSTSQTRSSLFPVR